MKHFSDIELTNGSSLILDDKIKITSNGIVENDSGDEIFVKKSDLISLLVPVGSFFMFSGDVAPEGYLLCDGSEISRTEYSKLFSVIGTKYGEGDGNTTFNLPNSSSFLFVSGSEASVIGSGISLGLTNGTTTVGLNSYGQTDNHNIFCPSLYGAPVASSAVGGSVGVYGTFGVTTDPEKSGLISQLPVSPHNNFIIKY